MPFLDLRKVGQVAAQAVRVEQARVVEVAPAAVAPEAAAPAPRPRLNLQTMPIAPLPKVTPAAVPEPYRPQPPKKVAAPLNLVKLQEAAKPPEPEPEPDPVKPRRRIKKSKPLKYKAPPILSVEAEVGPIVPRGFLAAVSTVAPEPVKAYRAEVSVSSLAAARGAVAKRQLEADAILDAVAAVMPINRPFRVRDAVCAVQRIESPTRRDLCLYGAQLTMAAASGVICRGVMLRKRSVHGVSMYTLLPSR